MSDLERKKVSIMEQEQHFAHLLASQVIERPKLSLWMILIPIFFVFYFFELNKCVNGRKAFAEHYLLSKKCALDEAVEVVDTGREPDVTALAALSDMSDEAGTKQAEVLAVLVEHYTILLRAPGEDFPSLVRAAYGSLTDYLLFLNRLNGAEREVTKALKPALTESHEGVNDVVSKMENASEILRRAMAEQIFA